ncbi:hydrogenase formation protein HypD [Thermodesulfobacteriota bacterium]
MPIKHIEEYKDLEISEKLLANIKKNSKKNVRLMEVCGTHTVSIFRSGIRSMLPATIDLLSGPGCPVCVTTQQEIDKFIKTGRNDDVMLVTFGDMMRVPGTSTSLQKERGEGRDIRVVYSILDALKLAEENPDKRIVFSGVGFETTAPTIAASIISAYEKGLKNFFVYSFLKIIPPALDALMYSQDIRIDGFILPGHVSVIIGTNAYASFFKKYRIPSVIAGFEPNDLLQAINILVEQIEKGCPELSNAYKRVVTFEGNRKACEVMSRVFIKKDASWRGLGMIRDSGLEIREAFRNYDAEKVFNICVHKSPESKECACGDILRGMKIPPECPAYKKICTPINPIGPCMVSSEGTCAAYYRYYDKTQVL